MPAADATRAAAGAWLDSLTADQRTHAAWPAPTDLTADAERVRWFYTPTDHGGLPLNAQTPHQQSLAMQLLASGMSRAGYATAASVLGLENILDLYEGWHVRWGRERGRDPGLYWVRIFGTPEETVWGWRFGGHHLSVNILVVDDEIAAATPCFIGADPATAELLGGSLRVLGGPEELARTLMQSLSADAKALALLHPRAISDIVTGNRPRVRPGDTMMHMQDLWRGDFGDSALTRLVDDIDHRAESASGYDHADHDRLAIPAEPYGIAGRDLDASQRAVLRELIASYTGRGPESVAAEQRRHYESEEVLDAVHFGWAGDAAAGAPHYYRLHGPRLLIEYDNTQRDANHAHSVWRDPDGDFGLDLLAAHRRLAHQGDR